MPRPAPSTHVRLRLLASSSSLFFETPHGAEQASVCAIPSPWLSEIAAASSCLYAVTSTPRRPTTLVHLAPSLAFVSCYYCSAATSRRCCCCNPSSTPRTLHTSIGYQHAFFTPQTARHPSSQSRHPIRATARRAPRPLNQSRRLIAPIIIILIPNLAHYCCCASASRSCCTTALPGPHHYCSLPPSRRSPTSRRHTTCSCGVFWKPSAQGPVKRASEPGKELLACLPRPPLRQVTLDGAS